MVALGAVLLFAGVLTVLPVVDANGLRDVTGATTTSDKPPAADLRHVRVVPMESAQFSGSKVLGQLGAYYRVGEYSVQSENGKLVWVAPLDFQGPVQWIARGTSPGVIVVSAENPDAPADLRQRQPMRYIPSALLNTNLMRHVYMTYGFELLLETTLQLDAAGDPKYIITLGRPTIGWSGEVVTAVVIVDPATGAMERIPRERFGELPAWISRVYPADLALEYNDWLGRYVHGWWNAVVTKRDVHLPVRGEVFGLLLDANRFVWFADHTSPNATDDSMTGFTYIDSRTGALVYYTSAGGEFNSVAAERSVSANPIITQGRLIPTTADSLQHRRAEYVGRPRRRLQRKVPDARAGASGRRSRRGRELVRRPRPSPTRSLSTAPSSAGARENSGAEATVEGTIDRFIATGNRILFTIRGRREIFTIADPSNPSRAARAQRRQRAVYFHGAAGWNVARTGVPRPDLRRMRHLYTERLDSSRSTRATRASCGVSSTRPTCASIRISRAFRPRTSNVKCAAARARSTAARPAASNGCCKRRSNPCARSAGSRCASTIARRTSARSAIAWSKMRAGSGTRPRR